MIYLLVLFLSVAYVYFLEKSVKSSSVLFWFLGLVPFYVILFFIPGFQDGIGTDYETYYQAYFTNYINVFRNKDEWVIFYMFLYLREWNLGPQAFFYIVTTINLIFLGFTLAILKTNGYKILIIFFIWFVVSNYYHNQMNIIRQFITVFSFPLLLLLIISKKYIYAFLLAALSVFTHQVFIVAGLFLVTIFFLKRYFKKEYMFALFIISIFFYIFILPSISYIILNYIFPFYSQYASVLNSGLDNYIFLATKLYYLPGFLLFYYIYYNKKEFYSYFRNKHKYFNLFIGIFSITALSFLSLLFIGRFNRIYVYFIFFSLFPFYYLYYYFIKYRNFFFFFLFSLYLLLPYILKVVVFPAREFTFSTMLFK